MNDVRHTKPMYVCNALVGVVLVSSTHALIVSNSNELREWLPTLTIPENVALSN